MATDEDRWNDLCAEYERERIGRGWLDLIFDVCSKIAPSYRSDVYNNGLMWDESAIYDLTQDLVLKRLLGDAQIDYIVASVSTLRAARGLIGKHVKQVLAHRVIPNQRDNVAGRLYSQFEQRGESVQTGDGIGCLPSGSRWSPAEPTREAMAAAVRIFRSLPRLPNRGTDRLSPLFTKEVLESAVEPLWDALGVPVTLNLLRRILEQAFTGMSPVLFQLGEVMDHPEIDGLSTEEKVLVNELAIGLVTALTSEQRQILVNLGILTDSEFATMLGVSRPTALNRRHETRDLIADYFGQGGVKDLSDKLQGAVLVQAQALLGGHNE
jgi:hypothetical protein